MPIIFHLNHFTKLNTFFNIGIRGIETSFCQLKHIIGIGNFHSKKREFIEQEIWARLILFNFCSIITNHVTIKNRKRKYSYQLNYTVVFNACHYFIRLRNNEVPPKRIRFQKNRDFYFFKATTM